MYICIFQHLDTSQKEIPPELLMKVMTCGLPSTKKDQHNITGYPLRLMGAGASSQAEAVPPITRRGVNDDHDAAAGG